MAELICLPHEDVTKNTLDEIIKIKSVAWPYSYEEQLSWINKNLKKSDIHVLLTQNGKPISYLNLIEIEVKIDCKTYLSFGVGNVCTIERGKGWGKNLIKKTNEYLKENDKIGLLFCKSNLVKFYTDNYWRLVRNEKLNIPFKNGVHTMVYNSPENFSHLEYTGSPF